MGNDRRRTPGNATHLHRYELHKRFATRLRRTGGITDIRPEPSSLRPTRVTATIEGETFCADCPAGELEIEWRPRVDRNDVFRIQCTPRDEPRRTAASFTDGVPMAVLESCLDELRERLPPLPDDRR